MMTVLYVIGFAIIVTAAIAGVSAAPWLPTKPTQRRRLLAQLPLAGTERIYDLGCGDGSLLFALAQRYSGITAIGYDISLLPLIIGWTRQCVWRMTRGDGRGIPRPYGNITLRFGNLFTQSVADADVVFVFLLAKAYPRLKEKFANELRDDARVVVEAWPFQDVVPSSVIKEDGLLPMYIYFGKQFKME